MFMVLRSAKVGKRDEGDKGRGAKRGRGDKGRGTKRGRGAGDEKGGGGNYCGREWQEKSGSGRKVDKGLKRGGGRKGAC